MQYGLEHEYNTIIVYIDVDTTLEYLKKIPCWLGMSCSFWKFLDFIKYCCIAMVLTRIWIIIFKFELLTWQESIL